MVDVLIKNLPDYKKDSLFSVNKKNTEELFKHRHFDHLDFIVNPAVHEFKLFDSDLDKLKISNMANLCEEHDCLAYNPTTHLCEDNYKDNMLAMIEKIRTPIVDYQEGRGICREETFTFFTLMYGVGQYLYAVLLAILSMVGKLLPIVDALLLIVRFILDKLIDILKSHDTDQIIKIIIFGAEVIALVVVLLFIYGFMISPLTVLLMVIARKFWNFVV